MTTGEGITMTAETVSQGITRLREAQKRLELYHREAFAGTTIWGMPVAWLLPHEIDVVRAYYEQKGEISPI